MTTNLQHGRSPKLTMASIKHCPYHNHHYHHLHQHQQGKDGTKPTATIIHPDDTGTIIHHDDTANTFHLHYHNTDEEIQHEGDGVRNKAFDVEGGISYDEMKRDISGIDKPLHSAFQSKHEGYGSMQNYAMDSCEEHDDGVPRNGSCTAPHQHNVRFPQIAVKKKVDDMLHVVVKLRSKFSFVRWIEDNVLSLVCVLFAVFWIGVAGAMLYIYSQFLYMIPLPGRNLNSPTKIIISRFENKFLILKKKLTGFEEKYKF